MRIFHLQLLRLAQFICPNYIQFFCVVGLSYSIYDLSITGRHEIFSNLHGESFLPVLNKLRLLPLHLRRGEGDGERSTHSLLFPRIYSWIWGKFGDETRKTDVAHFGGKLFSRHRTRSVGQPDVNRTGERLPGQKPKSSSIIKDFSYFFFMRGLVFQSSNCFRW